MVCLYVCRKQIQHGQYWQNVEVLKKPGNGKMLKGNKKDNDMVQEQCKKKKNTAKQC